MVLDSNWLQEIAEAGYLESEGAYFAHILVSGLDHFYGMGETQAQAIEDLETTLVETNEHLERMHDNLAPRLLSQLELLRGLPQVGKDKV